MQSVAVEQTHSDKTLVKEDALALSDRLTSDLRVTIGHFAYTFCSILIMSILLIQILQSDIGG